MLGKTCCVYIDFILVVVYIRLQTIVGIMPFKVKLIKEFQKYAKSPSETPTTDHPALLPPDNDPSRHKYPPSHPGTDANASLARPTTSTSTSCE